MTIQFKTIRYKNLLASGNAWTEIDLSSYRNTLVIGANGVGKCLSLNTLIKLRNKKTGEIIEMPIGEFYETQEKQDHSRKDK